MLLLCAALPVNAAGPRSVDRAPPRPPMAAGELLVRLRSDFPACAHCLVAKGQGLAATTGTRILDQVRLKHGITAMEPVFGGVHAAERRRAAQLRFGEKASAGGTGSAAAAATPDLSQVYLVRVDPKTDLLALAGEFRRDPNVVSAEPNYLYKAQSMVGRRQLIARPLSPVPLGHGQDEGLAEESSALPNDPFLSSSGSWGQDFPDLWGLFQIHAPEAWELSEGEGVVVAVVDTGIDISHRDLRRNVWRNPGEVAGNGIDDDGNGFVDDVYGWDFTRCAQPNGDGTCLRSKDPGPDIRDPVGHGTHVAGTIAAVGNNRRGIIGVAPRAQVMAVKGLDQSGTGSSRDLAEAIVYAAENGAQIINTSWGGPPSDVIRQAVEYVTTLGALVVAAVGDDAEPTEREEYPASLPPVVAVGATTHTDASAPFADYGGAVALVAPGGGDSGPATVAQPSASVLSLLARHSAWSRDCNEDDNGNEVCAWPATVIQARYVRAAGTSMATAHVSGVAALVRGRHPEFTRAQVRQALLNSTDDLGPAGWDPTYGYGRVNAQRAVAIDSVPVAEITVPHNRGKAWERDFPLAVRGTVLAPQGRLRQWRLSVRTAAGGVAAEVARGTESVVDDTLGSLTLDGPGGLELGQRYVLQLQVEDGDGNVAIDTKTFLMSDPRFAVIPIPDPFDEVGGGVTLSADGSRMALSRVEREYPGNNIVWLFDAPTRELIRVGDGRDPLLASDGGTVVYLGPADGLVFYGVGERFYRTVQLPRIGGGLSAVSADAGLLAFFSGYDLDPNVGNTDGSGELFLWPAPRGPFRQITNGPRGNAPFGDEIDQTMVMMNNDGRYLAFRAYTDLDPTATTAGWYQAFVYDDASRTVRQITSRSGPPENIYRISLSTNGNALAYEAIAPSPSVGIFTVDLASGQTSQVLDERGLPGRPHLSGDGTKLAFLSWSDLDPRVGNEDLDAEVFLLDLVTGEITQVTDTINNPYGVDIWATDDPARVLALGTVSGLNGLGLDVGVGRAVPSRRRNHAPVLTVPATIVVQEGRCSRTQLRATDPDGDAVTFFVQRLPVFPRLRDLANSVLNDHGDGTAELEFKPRHNEAGQYPLRVAAFDDAGGVAVRDITLIIEGTQPAGDASCDGSLGTDDIAAMIAALFDSNAAQCVSADTNDDGRIAVNDLVALLTKLSTE